MVISSRISLSSFRSFVDQSPFASDITEVLPSESIDLLRLGLCLVSGTSKVAT